MEGTTPPRPGSDAEAVFDLFDLAAPPLQAPVVARLVPLSARLLPIDVAQDGSDVVIGRARALQLPFRIDSCGKLSARHCELHVDPATLRVYVTDLSTNGTFINGTRISKGERVALASGDRLSLTVCGGPTEGSVEATTAPDQNERVEYVLQRLKEETTSEETVRELTCSVCDKVYIRPCQLLPCSHIVCAACTSRHLQAGKRTCMVCRNRIEAVRPTQRVQTRVEQLLRTFPALRRSAKERAKWEADDTIPPAGIVMREHLRDDNRSQAHEASWSEEGRVDVSGEDVDDALPEPEALRYEGVMYTDDAYGLTLPRGRCRHCERPSSVDGFRCTAGGPHLLCRACASPFPARPLANRPQRCRLCSTPYCHLYYGAADGGCEAQVDGRIWYAPLQQHSFTGLPAHTFNGSTTERVILEEYMDRKGIAIGDLWGHCLSMMKARRWVPDCNTINGELDTTEAVCHSCAAYVFAMLLFYYRRSISSDDLPESVTDRSFCWYGTRCQAQFRDPRHAQRLDHVCHPEKRKE